MKEIDIIPICVKILERLSVLDYEKIDDKRIIVEDKTSIFNKQLIFPVKNGGVDRISEQELRQLFIEEFKDKHKNLFYSIETPTQRNYKFGKKFTDISAGVGRSASLDMCIYKNEESSFKRELNIEFKYDNVSLYKIGKDILKLMHEVQNGAFILLLKNTDSGTLCNSNEKGKGVFNKFKESFERFKGKNYWMGETGKSIKLVIISLKQETLIYYEIKENDTLDDIFSFEDKFGDINSVKGNGWTKCTFNKSQHYECD